MHASSLNKPSSQEGLKHDAINSLREAAFKLTPAGQYRLATFVAENVGYVLEREPDHPDSPHAHPSFNDAIEAWQPIETAPKDGSPILAYSTEGVMYVAWQSRDGWTFFQNFKGDRWNFHPTHWQPLPTPPPRSLKLPDYRSGEAKTAESNHSPSTLNAETECLDCKGSGENLSNPMSAGKCNSCEGSGHAHRS